jgi:hypothetical protein
MKQVINVVLISALALISVSALADEAVPPPVRDVDAQAPVDDSIPFENDEEPVPPAQIYDDGEYVQTTEPEDNPHIVQED